MYTNCGEIPIFNFFEAVQKNEVKWLLEDSENIEDYNEEDLQALLYDILTEYNALTQNTKLLNEYRERIALEYLEAKYNFTKKLISMYQEYKAPEILLTMKKFDWKIDMTKNIEPQLAAIAKRLIGIKNQLNINKINFVKKYKKDPNTKPPNFDLDKQCVNLETGIPLSYKIDIYKDSIKRFVYWNKVLDNKNKAIENGKVKSRRKAVTR